MKHSPIEFEYNQITKYIFIGTNLCCEGHFEESLLKKGIKADISLEEERLDAPFGVDFFFWIPTKNHRAPSRKQFIVGVNMLKDLEKAGIKAYVHCERGHGRAPTFVAAYIAAVKGVSADDAIAFVKKKRPTSHINKNQRASILKVLPYLKKYLKT